ncbi:hypothetical protein DFH09DRAFT_1087949 [Mycena vulgaris]|nr:hypothetical protein DFH09DRAFT_1087949 [Mycena vulgaris]
MDPLKSSELRAVEDWDGFRPNMKGHIKVSAYLASMARVSPTHALTSLVAESFASPTTLPELDNLAVALPPLCDAFCLWRHELNTGTGAPLRLFFICPNLKSARVFKGEDAVYISARTRDWERGTDGVERERSVRDGAELQIDHTREQHRHKAYRERIVVKTSKMVYVELSVGGYRTYAGADGVCVLFNVMEWITAPREEPDATMVIARHAVFGSSEDARDVNRPGTYAKTQALRQRYLCEFGGEVVLLSFTEREHEQTEALQEASTAE